VLVVFELRAHIGTKKSCTSSEIFLRRHLSESTRFRLFSVFPHHLCTNCVPILVPTNKRPCACQLPSLSVSAAPTSAVLISYPCKNNCCTDNTFDRTTGYYHCQWHYHYIRAYIWGSNFSANGCGSHTTSQENFVSSSLSVNRCRSP